MFFCIFFQKHKHEETSFLQTLMALLLAEDRLVLTGNLLPLQVLLADLDEASCVCSHSSNTHKSLVRLET